MVTCPIKGLVDTIVAQLDAEKTKWPLVIDNSSGVAGTFFRYRDCNFLQAQNPLDLGVEKLRKALLGSIRYGKYLVIDLGDTDMFNFVRESLERAQEGLFELMMKRKITENENYLKLNEEAKEDGYKEIEFVKERTKEFACIFITKQTDNISEDLLKNTAKITIQ